MVIIFTKEQFTVEVEKVARLDKLTYAEAIVEICLIKDIDVRDVAPLISAPLKDKLEVEAKERNVIKAPKVMRTAFFGLFSDE
tara:strand:+ start:356 stop:604 length:249 start_codon:yes stop_codon:yes gene_type:complete